MTFGADPGLFVGMASSPPSTITFAIWGPIERDDLPGLCRRVCTLLERTGSPVAWCDVSGVAADAVTVDALARLQLAARRNRCQIRLRGASDELRDLVAFMGLQELLAS
jgi:ABC-type transporter Mla MlaB component